MAKRKKKTETDLKLLAKIMTLHCFRNSHLENLHSGEFGGAGSGFSDKEMKKLMIETVDNVYTFLMVLIGRKEFSESTKEFINRSRSIDSWDEPKLVDKWLKK